MAGGTENRLYDSLFLHRMRAIARKPVYRFFAGTSFVVYALISMLVGLMLELFIPPAPLLQDQWFVFLQGQPWWNYPAFILITPDFVLVLPFFATLSMLVVSAGVALGMTSAVHLGVQLIRRRRTLRSRGPAGAGTLASLSPALISLVTLGACCSTSAAALAGLTWTAALTGTTLTAVLLNTWYPGVFQIGVLYLALVAQEQLLRAYSWVDVSTEEPPASPPVAARARRTRWAGWVLRAGLLVGGATFLLTVPAEWTQGSPSLSDPAAWFQIVGQHLVPGALAVGAAILPDWFASVLRRMVGRGWPALGGRVAAATLGVSILGWFPASVANRGLFGWLNELFGSLGLGPSWAGVVPPFGGTALLFRWGLQFLLLGGFMVVLGLRPRALAELFGVVTSRAGGASPDPLGSMTIPTGSPTESRDVGPEPSASPPP